jgi:hypothetical protein
MEASIEVVNETGIPIEDVDIEVYFRHTYQQEKQLDRSTKVFEGTYNGEDAYRVSYSASNHIGIRAEKEGFWISEFGYTFTKDDQAPSLEHEGYSRKFKITLRKKHNPRPLYVNKVFWKEVPGFDRPYGFDLEKGDWVGPHGSGHHSDFLITFRGERSGQEEFMMEMEITFSNNDDGWIEKRKSTISHSRLLLGPVAPIKGYVAFFSDRSGVEEVNGELVGIDRRSQRDWEDIEGYWFRVRSEPDKEVEGDIKSRYGKILGRVNWSGRPENLPKVQFTYFFAPDHSRSLEWNGESLVPQANLQGIRKH